MPKQHENDPRMNPGELHQISAEIGGIKKAVEIMTDLWKQQEAAATAGRKSLHDKIEMIRDELGLQVAGLALRVDRLTDQVKMIEPSVKSFNDEALRNEGAKRLGKALIGALIAISGVLGWAVHEAVSWIMKH